MTNYLWEGYLVLPIVFIFGLCIGSFVNVCIYRIPHGISIIKPRSFCPLCKTPIPIHHNIPIISYILLSGRCRFCNSKIPVRYPIIEFISGIVFLILGIKTIHNLLWFFILCIFFVCLLISSGIDLEHRIIPDVISLPCIVFNFLVSYFNPYFSSTFTVINFFKSGLAIGISFGVLYLFRLLCNRLFKKESFGLGDIKLLCAISAIFGLKGVGFTLFFASVIGLIVCLFLVIIGKIKLGEYLPFGPFISLGCFLYFVLL